MKIAVYHNLPSGGARRAMVEMVKGLAARGHVVDEFCPQTADLSFLPLDGVARKTTVLPFRPRGVAVKRTPMLTPYVTSARLTTDLLDLANVGREAAAMIEQGGYEIVLTHDCWVTFAPDVLRFTKLPTVHYFHAATSAGKRVAPNGHSADGLSGYVKGAYYALPRQLYPRLRRRRTASNLRAAGRVLTNSDFAAAELSEAFGVEAQVCYLGVDVEHFRPLGMAREGFVLSVGAVHYYKGYRFLVEALGRMLPEQRPALVIAANSVEPGEEQVVRELAGDLGVTVTVRQVTDEEEMAALYNRAAAFVYAPIREPWGLAAVEAMACGTPVVAVAEGGVPESVAHGETGLLTSRDADAFAAAVGRVLGEPGLAERLGQGGATRARSQYAWSRTVEQVEGQLLEMAQRVAVR